MLRVFRFVDKAGKRFLLGVVLVVRLLVDALSLFDQSSRLGLDFGSAIGVGRLVGIPQQRASTVQKKLTEFEVGIRGSRMLRVLAGERLEGDLGL